jgi:hypothetical protein
MPRSPDEIKRATATYHAQSCAVKNQWIHMSAMGYNGQVDFRMRCHPGPTPSPIVT